MLHDMRQKMSETTRKPIGDGGLMRVILSIDPEVGGRIFLRNIRYQRASR
jgi:hypothetical protein